MNNSVIDLTHRSDASGVRAVVTQGDHNGPTYHDLKPDSLVARSRDQM
jgi:hypothetical protein